MMLLYMAVTLAALAVFNAMAVWMVMQYLTDQQVRTGTREAERMAVEAMPLLAAGNAADLYRYVCENSQAIGGRVLAVDRSAVVQADAFSTLNGMRMTHREISEVLGGEKNSAYGIYYLYMDEDRETLYGTGFLEDLRRLLTHKSRTKQQWVLYCAAPMVQDGEIIGAVVLSISIQDAVDRIDRLGFAFSFVTVIICAVMAVLNFLLSGAIIRPVRELTRGIRMLGQGQFSHRVKVRGRSEFARMAETFNAMSERLESIDRMRTQFVSNASHELKTPLSSVKILVQTLLAQQPFDPAMTKEFLSDIDSEVDRMSALVGNLLILVRMDEESAGNHETVDFSMIVDEAAASLEPMAKRKGVRLETGADPGCIVNGEGEALHRMVVNLVDNAVKYTPEGGMARVRLQRRGREIVLSVKDTGVGIAEKDLPYIFDRFYRVDKARDRQSGGTGLGLSIVKGIVARHGGMIDVASTPGQGTEVTVSLPGAGQAADL